MCFVVSTSSFDVTKHIGPEWWNWQTHSVQRGAVNSHGGSSPPSGTKFGSRRMRGMFSGKRYLGHADKNRVMSDLTILRLWWNGRHAALRALFSKGSEGSSPFSRTSFSTFPIFGKSDLTKCVGEAIRQTSYA